MDGCRGVFFLKWHFGIYLKDSICQCAKETKHQALLKKGGFSIGFPQEPVPEQTKVLTFPVVYIFS